jgi:ATP-dependent DNA ligase
VSPRVSRTLPTIEPILRTPRRDPFDDPAWLLEPKYDGYRGMLLRHSPSCCVPSKRGNVLSNQ